MLYFWVMLFSLIVYSVDESAHKSKLIETNENKARYNQLIYIDYLFATHAIVQKLCAVDAPPEYCKTPDALANEIKRNAESFGYNLNTEIKFCVYNSESQQRLLSYYIKEYDIDNSLVDKFKKDGLTFTSDIKNGGQCTVNQVKSIALDTPLKH